MVSTSVRRAAAKKLRANTTPHERKLWRALKEIPVQGTHFRRQAPIGPYVVDFFCPAKRLVVEVDGGHHADDDTARRDRERQLWLEKEGYRIVGFGIPILPATSQPCSNGFMSSCTVQVGGNRAVETSKAQIGFSPHPAASRRPSPSRGG